MASKTTKASGAGRAGGKKLSSEPAVSLEIPAAYNQKTSTSKSAMPKSTLTSWLILLGIICVILGVILAVKLSPKLFPHPDYSYNDFAFEKGICPGTGRECWKTTISSGGSLYELLFYNHPKDVESIPFDPRVMEAFIDVQSRENASAVITVPNNAPGEIGVAAISVAQIVGQRYGILNMKVIPRVQGTGPDQASCINALDNRIIVMIEQTDIDGIALVSPNCVVIGAHNISRVVAVAESLDYRLLSIILTKKSTSKDNSSSLPLPLVPLLPTDNTTAPPNRG